ncbi:hypothetical protein PILCRDRAFT_360092 [Piloderma croceum F 1598]|uniref:Uncharacterized protein n=1 Tax=Piloderma croceum (strain F 1598) TaxID=765440 RepID=A0A0C3FMP2_PILCF|nr:hypothetical protein PILCRDRAFT_360092 [Piloderma croceum F 1598]
MIIWRPELSHIDAFGKDAWFAPTSPFASLCPHRLFSNSASTILSSYLWSALTSAPYASWVGLCTFPVIPYRRVGLSRLLYQSWLSTCV